MHILTIDGSFFAQRILHAEGFTFKTEPEKEKKKFIQKLIISLCNEVNNIGTIDHVIFGLDSRSWRKDFKQVYPLTTTKTEDLAASSNGVKETALKNGIIAACQTSTVSVPNVSAYIVTRVSSDSKYRII
jgi:hypothetical protein